MNNKSLYIGGTEICIAFDVTYAASNDDGAPERDLDTVEIPGKNGELVLDNGRWKNKDIEYYCFQDKAVRNDLEDLRNYLLSLGGNYVRIENSEHSEEFRIGRLTDGFDPERDYNYSTSSFVIKMSCKPQRFLLSGELMQEFTSTGIINNPTLFESKPLLRVYGTGTLTVNGKSIVINTGGSEYIDIDCEAMSSFEGSQTRNSNVVIKDYPVLSAGNNVIDLGNGITRVIVTPKWWKI